MKRLLTGCLLGAACLLGLSAAAQTPAVFTGRIAYSRSSSANGHTVWLNDGHGSDQQLTTGFAPKASSDGRFLLYLKNTSFANPFYSGLWTRRRAGKVAETTVFTSSDYLVGHDYLLSDSSVVVSYICDIYHNSFDNAVNINDLGGHDCYDDGPDIRQADSLMAFHNSQAGLFTAKVRGSGRKQIPNTLPLDSWPAWSPDGKWLLFGRSSPTEAVGDRPLHVVNFYKIHPDGTGLTKLTPFAETDAAQLAPGGDWVASGHGIVFGGTINGRNGLWVLGANGGQPIALPTSAGDPISFVGSAGSLSLVLATASALPAASLELYPNPAADRCQLRLWLPQPGPVAVRLLDALGRPVAEAGQASSYPAGQQQLELPVAGLATGFYVCQVRTAQGIGYQRLELRR